MDHVSLKQRIFNEIKELYDKDEALAVAAWYAREKENVDLPDPGEIENDIRRLASGEPVQYVVGHQWFAGRKFLVNNSVLIPRPETEELVYIIKRRLNDKSNLRILDLGTGSGCIAVTLALDMQGSEVFAIDISESALHTAQTNSKLLGANVSFAREDMLASILGFTESFDVIVSNPPYIPETESDELAGHVKFHEPATALYAPGENPLIFYKAILEHSEKLLRTGGWLFLEIHRDHGRGVIALEGMKNFKNTELLKDMSANERFVAALKS